MAAASPQEEPVVLEIYREFAFEAAHRLPRVPADHQCSRLHGHSYRVTLGVCGEAGAETGWVVDFAEISGAFRPVRARLDHSYLNEVEGLENPTSEVLARWIFDRVRPALPQLSYVRVNETAGSGCIYRHVEG